MADHVVRSSKQSLISSQKAFVVPIFDSFLLCSREEGVMQMVLSVPCLAGERVYTVLQDGDQIINLVVEEVEND
jgi:hypothetical protein